MTKMIIYTKGTVKIVENPSIVEKFQLTEESAIEGFYCIYLLLIYNFIFGGFTVHILLLWPV